MQFTPTLLPGVLAVEIDRHEDERGFFARSFCEREFAQFVPGIRMVQSNISWNARRGTLRGMHFQWAPSRERKLVRCVRGAMIDVLLDLRPDSATFLRHVTMSLDADSRRAVFVPSGVAHGFQTLADDTEVNYQMSDFHAPDCAGGFRWNEPTFAINWPVAAPIVSERDRDYGDFVLDEYVAEYRRRAGAPPA